MLSDEAKNKKPPTIFDLQGLGPNDRHNGREDQGMNKLYEIKPIEFPADLLIPTQPYVVDESLEPRRLFSVKETAEIDAMLEEYNENSGNTLMNFLNLDPNTSDKLFNHMKQPSGATVVQQIETAPLDYSIEDEINDVFQIGAL